MHSNYIQLVTKLGSGGFGEVHKATVAGLHGHVALKILTKANSESVVRFKREVQILSNLDHQNIIPILKSHLDHPPYSFAMPLADSSLAEELPHIFNNTARVTSYFRQILTGMSFAHSQNVIHRDLKPQNILIIHGRVYVSDFGLGKRIETSELHHSFTASGVRGGTIVYAAPEQFENFRHANELSDIYALGKILYEMLTNKEPFPNININAVPEQFRYIVNKCIKEDPQDRFASVDKLLESFNETADRDLFRQVEYTDPGLDTIMDNTFSIESADAICRYFVENLENDDIFRRDFPKLESQYLSHFVNENLDEFKTIVKAFDNHVSGRLDFTFCDTVSQTYQRILNFTDDLDIFRLATTRILLVGATHNRFKVMNDFCELISKIESQEQSKAMIAAEIIKSNPSEFAVIDKNKSARLENTRLPNIVWQSIKFVRDHPI